MRKNNEQLHETKDRCSKLLSNAAGLVIKRDEIIELIDELLELRERNVWMTEERNLVRQALGIHGSETQTVFAVRRLKEKAGDA